MHRRPRVRYGRRRGGRSARRRRIQLGTPLRVVGDGRRRRCAPGCVCPARGNHGAKSGPQPGLRVLCTCLRRRGLGRLGGISAGLEGRRGRPRQARFRPEEISLWGRGGNRGRRKGRLDLRRRRDGSLRSRRRGASGLRRRHCLRGRPGRRDSLRRSGGRRRHGPPLDGASVLLPGLQEQGAEAFFLLRNGGGGGRGKQGRKAAQEGETDAKGAGGKQGRHAWLR